MQFLLKIPLPVGLNFFFFLTQHFRACKKLTAQIRYLFAYLLWMCIFFSPKQQESGRKKKMSGFSKFSIPLISSTNQISFMAFFQGHMHMTTLVFSRLFAFSSQNRITSHLCYWFRSEFLLVLRCHCNLFFWVSNSEKKCNCMFHLAWWLVSRVWLFTDQWEICWHFPPYQHRCLTLAGYLTAVDFPIFHLRG